MIVMAAAVVLLAIVAVVIALVTGGEERLLAEDSPEGVVQRFLLAMEEGDYRLAYDYLGAELKDNCTYDDFLNGRSKARVEEIQATLVGTDTFDDDDRAEVTIAITQFRTSGPFLDPFESRTSSYQQSYLLRQEEGQWRLTQTPWPVYWCPPLEPVRPAPIPAP